jgi:DNA-binding NarL/FixJ family response regulator
MNFRYGSRGRVRSDAIRSCLSGNCQIAAQLYVSEATVKTHVAHVLSRLGLRDRVQVTVFAYEHGIVRPGRGA